MPSKFIVCQAHGVWRQLMSPMRECLQQFSPVSWHFSRAHIIILNNCLGDDLQRHCKVGILSTCWLVRVCRASLTFLLDSPTGRQCPAGTLSGPSQIAWPSDTGGSIILPSPRARMLVVGCADKKARGAWTLRCARVQYLGRGSGGAEPSRFGPLQFLSKKKNWLDTLEISKLELYWNLDSATAPPNPVVGLSFS